MTRILYFTSLGIALRELLTVFSRLFLLPYALAIAVAVEQTHCKACRILNFGNIFCTAELNPSETSSFLPVSLIEIPEVLFVISMAPREKF